jgi:hypothetical protein
MWKGKAKIISGYNSTIGIDLFLPKPLHLKLGMGNLEWISEIA